MKKIYKKVLKNGNSLGINLTKVDMALLNMNIEKGEMLEIQIKKVR